MQQVVPFFLRHFDTNIQSGRLPFLHSKGDHFHGWMRFKKTPETCNDSGLIALIGAWPSTSSITTEHTSGGYIYVDAHICNDAGELLALSRQTVGVFG